ncbi:MAG: terminase large subunit, partial [Planktothrix sp.]
YNPSDEFHWIYDEVLTRPDCILHIVTYKDNPFLSQETITEIEKLKDVDVNLWNVFGLGLRGSSIASIYPKWELIDKLPNKGAKIYGIDFGFNNPTALIECELQENNIYSNELLYQTGLTNTDLIGLLKQLIPNKNSQIYADSAEPDRIAEIKKAGFNVYPAFKDVKDGIDIIKRHNLFITKNSLNLIKETKSYKWKQDNQNRIIDEPVKYLDHLKDAERYAIASYYKQLGLHKVVTMSAKTPNKYA